MDWYHVKDSIAAALTVSHDALHVIVGVAAQLAMAALLRRSLASWQPWGVLLLAELLNEWNDLTSDIWPDIERTRQFAESGKDVLLTMALPLLLWLVARHWPQLLRREEP